MKIRSITYFCNPKYPLDEKILGQAGQFLSKAKSAYEGAGYEVQTVRLATVPFPQLLGEESITLCQSIQVELLISLNNLELDMFRLVPHYQKYRAVID